MKHSPLFPFVAALLLCVACTPNNKTADAPQSKGTFVTIGGKKVYYEDVGKGVPLLLLSGGGINRSTRDFDTCTPLLSEHFRIIAPDSPGQGQSEQPDTLSYEILTNTMSQFIDALKLDSVYITGWSDGAIAAILLAEKRPDKVKKVIAVGANNGKAGFDIPPEIPLDQVVAPSLEIFENMNKQLVADYSAVPGRSWQKQVTWLNYMVYADEYFPKSVYDRIGIPLMIVVGDHDMISIEHGLEMHRAIKGSQYCVLPNTSHEVFSEEPAMISQIAIDFFNTKRPAVSSPH